MATPASALIIAYWLHMVATAVWGGGLVLLAVFVYPLIGTLMPAEGFHRLIAAVHKRVNLIGWLSIAALVATGLIQMGASPNYTGFLEFGSHWARAILLKHIAFVGILIACAVQTWGIAPAMERAALLKSLGKEAQGFENVYRKQKILVWVNLVLTVIVLAFTALARVA